MNSLKRLSFIMVMMMMMAFTNAKETAIKSDLELTAKLMKMDGKLYVLLQMKRTPHIQNKEITATVKLKDVNGKKQKVTLSPFWRICLCYRW